ncbi:MAG: 50S ribosomal protein L10 [Patescibacteria group bacterium]|nr:50S ribosomal protein L10 [Patescibacteria group bacterium]
MPLTKEQKKKILDELVEKFTRAKSIIFSDYRGLSVKDISQIRNNLREKGVEYNVSKKTLMRLAAEKAGMPEIPREATEGPCATAFSYEDEVAAARILRDFSKGNENLKLLGGIMEGRILSLKETQYLASIPSKEELIAKFMGSIKAPVSGFYRVLYGVMRKFVGTLQAVHDEKAKS